MIRNKLLLILSLTSFLYWTDSSPAGPSLGFDSLDTDIDDLKYENEGTLDDFFKTDKTVSDQAKTEVTATKNKDSEKKGSKLKYDLEDLKKFLKQIGLHDAESYDDAAVYGIAKGIAAKGVSVAGGEERKYKKGKKYKGFHKISHKDEYNDDREYYADDEVSGVIKKVGAKGSGFEVDGGAGFQKGYYHHDRDKGLIGKQGFSDKGKVDKEYEGFNDNQAFDAIFKIDNK